jgi:hypothetical protein
MFQDDELNQFHMLALAASASEGGQSASAEFHDFEAVPVLAGTIQSIEVIELDALPGVKPVNVKGEVEKGAKSTGMYRITLLTPDGVEISTLLDNGSIKAQFRAASRNTWTPPALPYTREALEQLSPPPFVGWHVFITLTGHWKDKNTEGAATNKRHGVMSFTDRDRMCAAWGKFKAAVSAARRRGQDVAGLLE